MHHNIDLKTLKIANCSLIALVEVFNDTGLSGLYELGRERRLFIIKKNSLQVLNFLASDKKIVGIFDDEKNLAAYSVFIPQPNYPLANPGTSRVVKSFSNEMTWNRTR
jgi:hypothetical protein